MDEDGPRRPFPGDLDEIREALTYVAAPMRRDSAVAALRRVRARLEDLEEAYENRT